MNGSRPHSRLGIASCAVFLVTTALVLGFLAAMFCVARSGTQAAKATYDRCLPFYLFFGTFVAPALFLIGWALGLAGLCFTTRRRTLAGVGMVLNIVALPVELAWDVLAIILNV